LNVTPPGHRDSSLDTALSSILDLEKCKQIDPDNKLFGSLVSYADRIREFAKAGDMQQLIAEADALRNFVESMELSRREALDQLQQRVDREIEQLASIDPLTGLWNRREFDRQIESRIASDQSFCILLFDLNQFKAVNDDHGHLCGDEVLKEVGERLKKQVRPRDVVCRWGGDEFVVILECDLPNANARSYQIAGELSKVYRLTGQAPPVHITVAKGVAQHQRGETAEQLFHRADSSMYRDKNTPG
jgi:diguanylate cyclase (GGDEF)-like protein